MGLRSNLKHYFNFTKTDYYSISIILIFILLLGALNWFLPFFISTQNTEFREFFSEIKYLDSLKTTTARHQQIDLYNEDLAEEPNVLFPFNPNTVSFDELLKLGLNYKTASIMIKFRSKGFKFEKKEDLKKVYGISDALYNKLEPFIRIEKFNSNSKGSVQSFSSNNPDFTLIDLNKADSVQLVLLPGIGGFYAKRILKYRNMLGGFVSTDQLKEVYGFERVDFTKISDKIFISNPESVRKIAINIASVYEIGKHPYAGFDLAKRIIKSRNENGPFGNIDDLQKRNLITSKDSFQRLVPYLTLWGN